MDSTISEPTFNKVLPLLEVDPSKEKDWYLAQEQTEIISGSGIFRLFSYNKNPQSLFTPRPVMKVQLY